MNEGFIDEKGWQQRQQSHNPYLNPFSKFYRVFNPNQSIAHYKRKARYSSLQQVSKNKSKSNRKQVEIKQYTLKPPQSPTNYSSQTIDKATDQNKLKYKWNIHLGQHFKLDSLHSNTKSKSKKLLRSKMFLLPQLNYQSQVVQKRKYNPIYRNQVIQIDSITKKCLKDFYKQQNKDLSQLKKRKKVFEASFFKQLNLM